MILIIFNLSLFKDEVWTINVTIKDPIKVNTIYIKEIIGAIITHSLTKQMINIPRKPCM